MRTPDVAGHSCIEIDVLIVVGNLEFEKINVRNIFEVRNEVAARVVASSNISPVVEVAVDRDSVT
jgi:hypothetical protein